MKLKRYRQIPRPDGTLCALEEHPFGQFVFANSLGDIEHNGGGKVKEGFVTAERDDPEVMYGGEVHLHTSGSAGTLGGRHIISKYTDYQDATSWYKHWNEDNAPELSYLTLGLVGEAGEFADNVKKIVRKVGQLDITGFRVAMREGAERGLTDELGDVLWYLNKLCTFLGVTIEDLMVDNTAKLHERYGRESGAEWPFDHITFEEAKELRGA